MTQTWIAVALLPALAAALLSSGTARADGVVFLTRHAENSL